MYDVTTEVEPEINIAKKESRNMVIPAFFISLNTNLYPLITFINLNFFIHFYSLLP